MARVWAHVHRRAAHACGELWRKHVGDEHVVGLGREVEPTRVRSDKGNGINVRCLMRLSDYNLILKH